MCTQKLKGPYWLLSRLIDLSRQLYVCMHMHANLPLQLHAIWRSISLWQSHSSRVQLWAGSSVLIHIMTFHETSHCVRDLCRYRKFQDQYNAFTACESAWPWPLWPTACSNLGMLNHIDFLSSRLVTMHMLAITQWPNGHDSSHLITRYHLQKAKLAVQMIQKTFNEISTTTLNINHAIQQASRKAYLYSFQKQVTTAEHQIWLFDQP